MIPIGDSPRTYRTPWVTYALILANLAVFAWMVFFLDTTVPAAAGPRGTVRPAPAPAECYGADATAAEVDRFFCTYGFQASEFFDTVEGTAPAGSQAAAVVILTLVTSLFLHAGWLHVGGNMLFLWVFGDNVEDRLGRPLFVGFYLAGGVVANLVQGALNPDSAVPTVGASGAVAAVLGMYIWLFPRSVVRVVIPFFILVFIPIPVPAMVMIALWFLQNLMAGLLTISEAPSADAGVAWFAHLGGFAFGLLLAVLGLGRERAPARAR